MKSEARKFLVVDDDEVFRRRLRIALSSRGLEVSATENPKEALQIAEETKNLNVILDLKMPEIFGLDLLEQILEKNAKARVLILTGYGSISTAVEATRKGASQYLMKPADTDEILAAFEKTSEEKTKTVDSPLETPSLAKIEWEHIQKVLQDCRGNISETARRLGIHRRSLQRKLHKHAPRT